jgi:uroporphyrinogen-III synthase
MTSAVYSPAQPLAGRRLWLTRPAPQLQELQQALENLGARILALPLLEIVPVALAGADKERLMNLDAYDLVFFVSSNAASIGLDAIGNYWPQYPSHILNFAVGPGTAKVVQGYGLDVFYPTERMSSEAMLALPQLQDIKGRKALIVRGVGGREIMAEALLARGATVDYAELYQRRRPQYEQAYLRQCLQQQPDAVIISSAEALANLCALLQPLGTDWRRLALYVSSDRLAADARQLGFMYATVLAGASDAAIIEGLVSAFAPGISR